MCCMFALVFIMLLLKLLPNAVADVAKYVDTVLFCQVALKCQAVLRKGFACQQVNVLR